MSAFQVSDRHIDALLTWVIETPQYQAPRKVAGMTVYDQPDLIGQILVEANNNSVNSRYNDNTEPHEYKFRHFKRVLSPVEVIKACDCLAYQSCEFDGWKESKAAKILHDIREGAINMLDGYKSASWSIE